MKTGERKPMGSSEVQAKLWGARAKDWAEVQEGTALPLFQAALERTGITHNAAVLDVGCGSGMFCELAAQRGARVAGLDAAEALINVARRRVPHGTFHVGEMEDLPYADSSFDVVTGFNSFQYAASPANALKEARRVARGGAKVVIATWGKPHECEAAVYLDALRRLLPPPPPGAPGPFALSDERALEGLAREAGLTPLRSEAVDMPFAYPDTDTAVRGLLSAGPAVRAIETSGEERVKEAVLQVLAQFRTPSGGHVMKNKFLYLLACA